MAKRRPKNPDRAEPVLYIGQDIDKLPHYKKELNRRTGGNYAGVVYGNPLMGIHAKTREEAEDIIYKRTGRRAKYGGTY